MSFPTQTLPRLLAAPAPAAPRAKAATTIFLPKEHGSWSLALEPLALGLWLAPSGAGVALLATVLAGFFARRPFKAAFAPQHSARRRDAREGLVMLATLALAGGFEVLVLGDLVTLWPLLLAVPCGALFVYFDAQGEGRAVAAEVAGSAAFAILPAVFATLAGWPASAALPLAAFALVRSVPTVLTIRRFLRQRKGEAAGATVPLLTATVGLAFVMGLSVAGIVSAAAVAGAALLLARTAWLLGPWRPAWSARQAGITEAILGIAYLALVIPAVRFS